MNCKYLLSFFFVVIAGLFAKGQQPMNNYTSSWKKIDSLIQKRGLTQSALTEVNKIYALAKKENNDPQIIKSLIYKSALQQSTTEDAEEKIIRELEKESQSAREPARSILNSIIAESYWGYFQQHRYKIYDRTQTVSFKKEEVATWGTEDFHQKISALYLASIKNETLLQQTKLEPFDAIITKGNSGYLRPTLFDLLAHRALDYFRNDEQNITKPAYAFEIDNDSAFAEASQFISYRFRTNDTVSLHFKALQLYQRILKFHINDNKPDALIDADIDRVMFVKNYGVMQDKDSLYRKSLATITSKHPDHPVAAQAWFLIAASYAEQGNEYQPLKNETYRYSYLKAKEICNRVIAQKDSSEGKANAVQLLASIERKEVDLQTEKVNIPNQPFRTLVLYRNFTQLYFRIIPMDKTTKESLIPNSDMDEYWTKLLRIPAVKTFAQSLPDTKDYQKHSAEIKIDALPVGQYALIASVNNDFSIKKNPLAIQFFYVSNLAWIKKGNDYFVLNRESGQPVARANVQAWYRYFDNQANRLKDRKGENLFTDKNGQFTIIPSKTSRDNYLRIELATNNDRLFMDDYEYTYNQPSDNTGNKETKTTFLFTDRAIYRPGQLFYFKGIAISTNSETKKSIVLANLKTKLVLYDVNQQVVDSIAVTTNEFGSYSGKFTLPSGVLNGYFRIVDQVTGGSQSFSVEEYKRPKFSVEIKKPEGTYRLNDSIKVTGNAKAFAGNNIDGASVKYRVVRRTVYPLWYRGYGKMIWPPRPSEEIEIANGETKTGINGEFTVPFKAIPDLSVEKKTQPTFYYEVNADITDINGETRSGNISVAVAYQALKLSIDIPEKIHSDSIRNMKLSSSNLNDIFEKATVTLTIHQLKTPSRIFRTRYWEQPDQFVMTREEYYRLFPYDIYSDETDLSKWEKGEKILEVTDTTSSDSKFKISNSKLLPGWYVIEAVTKDKYGEEVKDLKYVQVFNESSVNPFSYSDIEAGKTVFEPGDKASYQFSTNFDSVFVIHEIERSADSRQRTFFTLSKNIRSFETAITENDHGGLEVSMAFVKYNRFFSDEVQFLVPRTNKDLVISYETFRDKTLPGADETWKLKIAGYKGDKIAAEMLTAMYDASLDEFKPQRWYKPSLWNMVFKKTPWQDGEGFTLVSSTEKYMDYEIVEFLKSYDRLITENYSSRRDYQILGNAMPRGGFKSVSKVAANMARDESVDGDGSQPMMREVAEFRQQGEMYVQGDKVPKPMPSESSVQIRKNFNETAFFFPDLKTDSAGNISFSFTMPEALTKWKWMSLAHTKELAFGYEEKTIITQKDLMVQPNAPRFLREGDRMDFSAKIVNMTDKELTGQVQLQFFDPSTNVPVDGWFQNVFPNQYFTVGANQSVPASFSIEIPFRYNKPVSYRIIASTAATAGNFSDGEEALLPVISNRLLVTESLQLPMRGEAEKNFKFDKLLQSGNSETLDQYAVTVEFTSNPAWYAVQSLPYLNEYPYECAEQTFNRYYANALASKIANSSPRIKQIFDRWKTQDTAALMSNLQKNPELKSVLLEETPWVLQAKSEAEQKRNIALLFDMVRMNRELQSSLDKLADMQTGNGGFVWFKGGADDRYITQYILTGIGHLKKLGALPSGNRKLETIITKAIGYLDNKIKEDLDELEKRTKKSLPVTENIGYIQIQYLYMRSFFIDKTVPGNVFKAYNYYRKQSQQYWLKQTRYMQGMIALALNRTGDIQTAKGIMNSLKQNSINNPEMGMYWKEVTGGYYWHQAPIETHSLLIEAFVEITKDPKLIMDLRTWLLKQKQTQNWKTTKATADACYALLLPGGQQKEGISDLLANTPVVTIQLGDQIVRSDNSAEAGTGYFKETITSAKIKPAMGNIRVSLKSDAGSATQPSWGAVYWQYFENLENIKPAATPLKLKRKLFVEKNTDRGPVLQPVNDGDILKTGDKIKVRIEISTDRDMEYVHMKDMRAASMEPVNVISEYKWQGGLGYYESTKDASTNFFFNWLPKGTHVFEYPVFITHTGTFSNGVTSIQCMYAPEFASHSEGIKINVE